MAHTNVNQGGETFTDVKTIAERTKEVREALGLSQVELAARAKVSPGTIGNLEAGTRKNPRELLAIAAALQVNPEWLKSGRGMRAIGEAPADTPYSEQLALSPSERDLVLSLRKLPEKEQQETINDVMHRAEDIEQMVEKVLAQRGISISAYVTASRAAETLPAPPSTPDAKTIPPRQAGDGDQMRSPLTHRGPESQGRKERKT